MSHRTDTTDAKTNVELSRRGLLLAGGAGLVVASLSGCELLSTDPDTKKAAARAAASAKEAPDLAKLVKSGKLPALSKRLPKNPMVVKPIERAGAYGGTWNLSLNGPEDYNYLVRTISYEQMMRWNLEFTEPIPNIAESVDESDDGRVFTFHLRQGMRWSDGKPFTADDVLFNCNDWMLDGDIPAGVPTYMTAGGKGPTCEKVDDHTVRISFAAPNGLLLQQLATPDGREFFALPKHYLATFHKKYNPDADSIAKQQGFKDWVELIATKVSIWTNPERPTVNPWILQQGLGSGPRVVAVRNPYYWKVDPDGRQLPYLDKVVFDVVEDLEVVLLKMTNGELHMDTREINTLANKPVLAQHRDTGKYDFIDLLSSYSNRMMISLNLTHKNKTMREIFQNKDFRIGLSYAINRDELVKAIYQGQGEPYQAAPRPESDFYDEEMAKQYTEYDVAEANKRLDAAGYGKRDGEKFRLGPDGKRIQFSIEVSTGKGDNGWVEALELIRKYWKDVGIDMKVRPEDDSLWGERTGGNDHDAAVSFDGGSLNDAILNPLWAFPISKAAKYGIAWAAWFNGAQPAEEPPAPMKQQMQLYRKLMETPDAAGQAALFKQIVQIAKEQFYTIGTVLPKGGYGVKKNNLHNVPKQMMDSFAYPTPGPSNPEQYFLEG